MTRHFRPMTYSAAERARHRRQYAMLLELDDHLLRPLAVTRVRAPANG